MNGTRKEVFQGRVEVCLHQVSFWYDIDESEVTTDIADALTEEAERRAKELINQGFHSGSLNHVIGGEREVGGFWKIERD